MPDHLHERHRRRAEGRRARPALPRRPAACRPSTGSTRAPGELVWCTAASGWSKSARNVFIAPVAARRGGAAARRALRPRRAPGDPRRGARRGAVHGADRVPRHRQARRSRGRRRRCAAWSPPARRSTPRCCAPGTRRPACGSATATARPRPGRSPGMPLDREAVPGLDGPPAAGHRRLGRRRRARRSTRPRCRPSSAATSATTAPSGPWRTGDRVTQDDEGFLFFEGRADDVIISAGYRIGPFEVESALVEHPAVAEAAVVAAPDDERGAVVRAVVVLRDGHAPVRRARARAAGPRQGADRALQVPAHRRLRRRAAQDRERQGPPRSGMATPRRAPSAVADRRRAPRGHDADAALERRPSRAGSARRRRRRWRR